MLLLPLLGLPPTTTGSSSSSSPATTWCIDLELTQLYCGLNVAKVSIIECTALVQWWYFDVMIVRKSAKMNKYEKERVAVVVRMHNEAHKSETKN